MGYSTRTYVLHGLDLDPDQSQKFTAALREWVESPAGHSVRPHAFEAGVLDVFGTLEHIAFQSGSHDAVELLIIAQDSDSRIHDAYEPGFSHGLGVLLAQQGDPEFTQTVRTGANDEQKAAFLSLLGDVLVLAGLDTIDPGTVVASYTG